MTRPRKRPSIDPHKEPPCRQKSTRPVNQRHPNASCWPPSHTRRPSSSTRSPHERLPPTIRPNLGTTSSANPSPKPSKPRSRRRPSPFLSPSGIPGVFHKKQSADMLSRVRYPSAKRVCRLFFVRGYLDGGPGGNRTHVRDCIQPLHTVRTYGASPASVTPPPLGLYRAETNLMGVGRRSSRTLYT